jgi:3-phenylpropionate/trans-cinnamate dioxygenase ferredoxin component
MSELDDDWHDVCAADELDEEEVLQHWIGDDVPIAIYNINGEFYATADKCSHQQAFLSDGFITDELIECPLHQGRYHVPSGAVRAGPACEDIPTYSVQVHEGRIFVQYAENIE